MAKFILMLMFVHALWACNSNTSNPVPDADTSTGNSSDNSKYQSIVLQYNEPILVDSSDWAIYPLTLKIVQENDRSGSSYGGYDRHLYWNVAFFNAKTKETRLLSEDLKMLINSISAKYLETVESVKNIKSVKKYIYYSITTKDYNLDGTLNSQDPGYLFISDLSGQNFKQISPENHALRDWRILNDSKVLIQAHKDINNDKKFTEDDEIVSFVYDTENQKIETVFDENFNLNTKQLFHKLWVKNN